MAYSRWYAKLAKVADGVSGISVAAAAFPTLCDSPPGMPCWRSCDATVCRGIVDDFGLEICLLQVVVNAIRRRASKSQVFLGMGEIHVVYSGQVDSVSPVLDAILQL